MLCDELMVRTNLKKKTKYFTNKLETFLSKRNAVQALSGTHTPGVYFVFNLISIFPIALSLARHPTPGYKNGKCQCAGRYF